MDEGTVSLPVSREDWSRWFWGQGAYGIVPVSPLTKQPFTHSWKECQTKRMTEAELNLALSNENDWAPAVVPGESTVFCIDCDCEHATDFVERLKWNENTLAEYRPEAPERVHVWFKSKTLIKAVAARCHVCGKEKAFDIRSGHLYTIVPGTNRQKRPESPIELLECSAEDVRKGQLMFSCATKLASVVKEWGWAHGKGGCNQYTLGLSCVLFFAEVDEQDAKYLVPLTLHYLGDREDRKTTVEATYKKGDAGLQISKYDITDEQRDVIRGVLRIYGFGKKASGTATQAAGPMEEKAPGGAAFALYPRTDIGNAKMFSDQYAELLRYDHRRHAWFAWVGHFWSEDKIGEAIERAKEAVRKRAADALAAPSKQEREAELLWCKASESRGRVEAMLALAKSDPRIATSGEDWDPHPFLLAVENGVLDLQTGTLRSGKPEDMITLHTLVGYDQTADAPRWRQFIGEIFCGDKELVEFIQKSLGWSLTGSVREQFWFLCWGSGANGKSTLFKAVRYVIGNYAFNVPFQTFEQEARNNIPSDVAALVGRRFITALESSESARLNEARIKLLTGADPVTARHLYGKWFEFVPVGKLWLATNHRPRVFDDSFAFWRRVCLIPFNARFEGDKADKDIEVKLNAEAPGILRWLVEGCLRWQKEGLNPPPIVLAATDEYRQESDVLAEFLDDKFSFEDGAEVGGADAVLAYGAWCDARRMDKDERLGSRTLLGLLAKRYPKKKTKKGRFYLGLRLKEQTRLDMPEGALVSPAMLKEHMNHIKDAIVQENHGEVGASRASILLRMTALGLEGGRVEFLLRKMLEDGAIYERSEDHYKVP